MDRLDATIHGIYEAVETPECWESAGGRIADLVDGRGIHLMLLESAFPDARPHLNIYLRGDPAGAREYLEHYAAADFRYGRVLRNRRGAVIDERAYVSPEEARKSPIHQELFPKYGTHNLAGANLSVDDGAGWFGISNKAADRTFDAQKIGTLERIAPHLHRAFAMIRSRERLRLERDMAHAALDANGAGIVLFSKGEARYANPKALSLFGRGFLAMRRGRIGAAHAAADRRIASLFAQAALTGHPQTLALTDPAEGTAYHLHLHLPVETVRMPAAARRNGPMVLSITAYSRRPDAGMEAIGAFAAAYGLPPAEARTVAAVINEVNLADEAAARGVTLDTVRKQLKSALARLELKSQKQLVRLFDSFRMLHR